MKSLHAALVAFIVFFLPATASAQTVKNDVTFRVAVSQQNAIKQDGFINLNSIFVSVTPTTATQAVTVNTSIYSIDKTGNRTLVVTLGCHYGDLAANQTATYRGDSCDSSPNFPNAPTKSLIASTSVISTMATPAKSAKVRTLPVPNH